MKRRVNRQNISFATVLIQSLMSGDVRTANFNEQVQARECHNQGMLQFPESHKMVRENGKNNDVRRQYSW